MAVVNNVTINHPDDSDALKGVKAIKVVYDFNSVSEPKTMSNLLKAIIDARGRALAAKVKSDLVIAFRGPALRLIQKPSPDATAEQKQIGELVAELKKEGAKLEACSFAAGVMNLDPAGFLLEVKVVGNTSTRSGAIKQRDTASSLRSDSPLRLNGSGGDKPNRLLRRSSLLPLRRYWSLTLEDSYR